MPLLSGRVRVSINTYFLITVEGTTHEAVFLVIWMSCSLIVRADAFLIRENVDLFFCTECQCLTFFIQFPFLPTSVLIMINRRLR